jgi:DNA-binding HxlR family transcriptional regulator
MAGMGRRSYGQFCGLAHALDVVGERWTLLLVRELGSGPKRYTELSEALSGIGTSLLATRVRQLEADGVIQRKLARDQPGSAVVYELSAAGRELAEAVIPLALWGARHQMPEGGTDSELFRAEWMLTFLAADLRDEAPHDLDAVYEFTIDDSTACLRLRGGKASVRPGKSATPSDVSVHATAATIAALLGNRVTVADAVAQGLLEITGDPAAIDTLLGVIEKRLSDFTPA